mmetsp:Transcript_33708/g.88635  ORF Transcript_33708/g.88635 Transcript_33708/m.88635 type:complete len:241 (+) Transcript_33708:225-947(+)
MDACRCHRHCALSSEPARSHSRSSPGREERESETKVSFGTPKVRYTRRPASKTAWCPPTPSSSFRWAIGAARAWSAARAFGGRAHRSKVGVEHGLCGREALLVIVPQEFVEEVDSLRRDEVLVVWVEELGPRLARVATEDAVKVGVELQVVLVEVVKQLVGAEHLDNLYQLIVVVVAVEEGLLSEDHASKHAAQRPHVEGVIIVLQIDEELRPLEVARRHAHVVLALRVVELSKTPVDEA